MNPALPQERRKGRRGTVQVLEIPVPANLIRNFSFERRLRVARERAATLHAIGELTGAGYSLSAACRLLRRPLVSTWRHRQRFAAGGFDALIPGVGRGRPPKSARAKSARPTFPLVLKICSTSAPDRVSDSFAVGVEVIAVGSPISPARKTRRGVKANRNPPMK
jgi:hypothetical protein